MKQSKLLSGVLKPEYTKSTNPTKDINTGAKYLKQIKEGAVI